MESVADRVLWSFGVKTKLNVQLAPGFTLLPQLSVSEKSLGSVPPMLLPVMLRVPGPVLVSVTTIGGLGLPINCTGKVTEVAESDTMGPPPPVPVPVMGSVCGLPGALSATLIEALRAPLPAGANVTVIAQFAPALRLAGQLFVWAKSPEFGPVIVMPLVLMVSV